MDCSICFDQLRKPLGIPECCKHVFCFDCLRKWTESHDTCPIDRMQFQMIRKKNAVDGPVIEKATIKFGQISTFSRHPGTIDEWLNLILEIQRSYNEIFSNVFANLENFNSVLNWSTRAVCRQYLRVGIHFRDIYAQRSRSTGFYQFLNQIQRQIFVDIFGLLFENYNVLFDIFERIDDSYLITPFYVEKFIDEFDLMILLVNIFVSNFLDYITRVRRPLTERIY
ncbi:unnamed protein product [Hymenolepis diminuta]|uniref:RING-type domain-containing protein n=1 Tax=Hymenolepis diminuta TaxID=6216 RepID=A0A564Z2K5_HYMDI|nr:unnamed protein product [Hymenolepis diminuta]